MGTFQREQPKVREELVRPAMMIQASSLASSPMTFPLDAPQSHTHPSVYVIQAPPVGMLEVAVPASQARVDLRDDRLQTHSAGPLQTRLELFTSRPGGACS